MRFFFLTLTLSFFFLAPASALEVPELRARVNDYAGMLSSGTIAQLEANLQHLEKEDSTQIVVLTIPSLEGDNLESFSLKVVETWQLGQKSFDNGALLLIAQQDRKMRIEVGYGLEGVLTDLTAGRIIRDIITPKFKGGNFDSGVSNGVSAMIATVKGEFKAEDFISAGNSPGDDLIGFGIFIVFALINIGRMFSTNKFLAGSIGAIAIPSFAALFMGFKWTTFLLLVPVGFCAGYLASLLLPRRRNAKSLRRGYKRSRDNSGFGGFGTGGGGGFGGGGFSGGGGGFGGGGASGGW